MLGVAFVIPFIALAPGLLGLAAQGAPRTAASIPFLALVGAWLVARAARRRHVVRVSVRGGDRRTLALAKHCTLEDRDRLARALLDLGWPI